MSASLSRLTMQHRGIQVCRGKWYVKCNIISRANANARKIKSNTRVTIMLSCPYSVNPHGKGKYATCLVHSSPPSSGNLILVVLVCLDILAQPSDALAVSLPHDDTAHEDFNRSDTLERHLALAGCLI